MNRDEAKQVLLLYRPDTADAEDPQVVRAMEVARQDPELARWFKQHVEFQRAMRGKLRQLDAPARFKAGLRARSPALLRRVWGPEASRRWLAAAAGAVLLMGLAALWIQPAAPNRFAKFQERMVSQAMRQYVMEWETSDMARLRQSIAARGGPSNYDVPKPLTGLKLSGGGVLSWQSHPVSMVCFDRGGGQMLFLFVIKRAAVNDPPSAPKPRLAIVHEWMTASWTEGDNAYLLTGSEEGDLGAFARKYL